ncbi:MAG: beta-lactamase family protein [Oscillospiraceae bacterium]|nr:beta-lactamase family protein [Oscillospiraceae bacterium]
MKKFTKRITAALCAGLWLTAVTFSSVSAEEADTNLLTLPSGMTIEKVQFELDDKANQLIGDEPWFASAAVGVFQGNEVLYTGYLGETDIEDHIRADENSVYEWGSISKTLIWVSAMQLWEQGRLDLDRDVREYLPDGFFQHLSYDEPITMLNLMNHNAGWQETTRPIWKTDENAILPLGEELKAIEPAQIHRPGEVTAYSNYGAAVAAYVIECVTGQDYCDYVHEHIFEPLGMEHTALNPTHSDNAWVREQRKHMKSYRFSIGHCIDLGNCLNYVTAYPSGAAAGTLADLMTYGQALVNDDAPLFQYPETQAVMFTGTDFYGKSDIPICAHGFWCTEYAVRTYGHNGGTTAGQANMLFDLDSKTGLVVMVNEPNGSVFLSDTPALVFGELSPDKYISDTSEKAKLHGYYLPARSTYRGMLKFIPYLTAVSAGTIGDIQNIGNSVYQISDRESAVLLGAKTCPDGNMGLQQPSMDLLHDSFYLVKLCLFTVYVLLAVTALYILRIRRKLKKHGKRTAFHGSSVMAAGYIARLVSVLALLGTYVVYAKYQGGIPVAAGAVLGTVQMFCTAVCGISAAASCISILSHKGEKALTIRYILNTVGCVLPIIAILYFEMYRFW